MPINSNIYFNKRGAADIIGGAREGLTLGQMIKDRKLREQNQADQKNFRSAFTNYISGEGDQQATLGEMAKYNPEMVYKLKQQEAAAEANKIKAQQEVKDREFDRNYKNEMLKLQGRKQKADEAKQASTQGKIKADQYKVGGFAKRALMAEQELAKLPEDVGTGSFSDTIQGWGYFPEAMKSEDRKLFDQTQRNFISAVLRRESGAAISDQEMENESKKYFPQPGDSQKVLTQKSRARQQAVNNLRAEAGDAMEAIASAPETFDFDNGSPMSLPGINNAMAKDPKKIQDVIGGMTREQKIKLLMGK
jgi:hypothetical protein